MRGIADAFKMDHYVLSLLPLLKMLLLCCSLRTETERTPSQVSLSVYTFRPFLFHRRRSRRGRKEAHVCTRQRDPFSRYSGNESRCSSLDQAVLVLVPYPKAKKSCSLRFASL